MSVDVITPQDMRERRDRFKSKHVPRLEKNIAVVENKGYEREGRMLRWIMAELLDDNASPYKAYDKMVRVPVTIEEFCQSREFVGALEMILNRNSWR